MDSRRCLVLLLAIFVSFFDVDAWTLSRSSSLNRRDAIAVAISSITTATSAVATPLAAFAYTPDSDKLRESLYLMSRAQEATVQIERIVRNSKTQEDLKQLLKLKLKLVQASYRLLDQINFASQFIDQSSSNDIITATEAGNIAVESLQDAVVYVRDNLTSGPMKDEQKEFLIEACQETRDNLFIFLNYMPQDKLEQARKRIEDENVDNREEFDRSIDENAGVYNPVKLPWK